MERIQLIENEIKPLKAKLQNHKLYRQIKRIKDIRGFMSLHVYAVWDFMSLLKALQNKLTCTEVPWTPAKNASTARFINEIVLGEESDIDERGRPSSHFEMYLEAMKEVGASTDTVERFIKSLENFDDPRDAIKNAYIKDAARDFMQYTFNIIASGETHKIAAAFTFGREELIPDIFIEIIKQSGTNYKDQFPKLLYYLNRHIELDGDEHGPLSKKMIAELCGEDDRKWEEVLEVAQSSLHARLKLWDGIGQALVNRRSALLML